MYVNGQKKNLCSNIKCGGIGKKITEWSRVAIQISQFPSQSKSVSPFAFSLKDGSAQTLWVIKISQLGKTNKKAIF